MAQTKNTISSALEQFLRLEKNALEIISKLSDATTSSSDTVALNVTDDTGAITPMLIPSFGFLKSEIKRLDTTIQQLAGLGDASAVIKLPDGTTKRIFQASILRDPPAIKTLLVPAAFKIKNNWFFENFLNPLLLVSFDVTGMVPDTMTQSFVKRIILNTDDDTKRNYFDTTFKGKNDIIYEDLLVKLDANNIQFFVDESKVDLPVSIMRYSGTFDVVKVLDENTTITSNNQTITTTKRKYKLNQLTYTDVLSGVSNNKTLKINDQLITTDGTKYNVDTVDNAENTVVLKRLAGSQPIAIGVAVFTIYSPPFTSKEIQVNVGFDERQVIFIKPIDPIFNVAASQYSPGVGFWSNEMTINTPSGSETLETFYKDQVVDFGQQFINSAKEKFIPSVLGLIPSAPTLNVNNFQVVQVNTHKKNVQEEDSIKQKLASKVSLENEINALDAAITLKKADLNNSTTKSDAEKKKLKSDLDDLARQKSSKVSLYSSVIKELNTIVKQDPSLIADAVFHVRGFWALPAPQQSTSTAPQEVIQFKVSYRYIKKDGTASDTKQLEFVDNDGITKTGFFSNWVEYKSDIRKRIFNDTTGFYEWDIEDVTNADVVNINQLDISISKGEQVQFRIKSLSEAGWPTNPLESDWSDVITVDFPDALQLANQEAQLLTDTAAEEVRVNFQNELNARGLDLHLLSAFTQGDRYFAHISTDITSGFFTPEGNVIDLFEKLKTMSADIQGIKQLIAKAKGTLVIYLVDQDGNVTNITANSTTSLFAGYYKQLIQPSSTVLPDHGKIITKSYIIRLENSAATPLELASYLPGGLNIMAAAPSSGSTITDYNNNRQYEKVPLSLTSVSGPITGSIKQESPFQSAQSQGEWIYIREKSVGLDQDLYNVTTALGVGIDATTTNQVVPTVPTFATPQQGCFLFPTSPLLSVGAVDPGVWNGTFPSVGGGRLTEFCISKDHPDISSAFIIGTTFTPQIQPNLVMVYPRFIHSDFFYKDITLVDGKKQLQYVQPLTYVSGTTNPRHYPAKLGFYNNDSYLIGRYTCGAYLFLAPSDYTAIAVDGSTDLAKQLLDFGEENAINIPLIFQFRCSDKLGKVGGFRTSGAITNITYTKKIGIDIQVRSESLFSFDIEVSCKYDQDSLATPVYIPNVALDRLSSIRSQAQSPTPAAL